MVGPHRNGELCLIGAGLASGSVVTAGRMQQSGDTGFPASVAHTELEVRSLIICHAVGAQIQLAKT